ncbi:MAG: hypothetical protein IT431_11565 [Phycisphaerales bacterium]|nr:hypothetical protein [Phycisphaerales bacterium]
MTTPDPNNPPPTPPTVEELQAQLTALREFRAGVAKGFGLDPAASEDSAILSRITDTTAEVSALKSAAEASKVDAALREAFTKSGASGHYEDFHNLAAALFHVDPKTGKVVTKPDATTPNVDPDTWCVVELRQRRPGWWPVSQGANARGAGYNPSRGADDSCFRPGPGFNFTQQLAFEHRYGAAAADAARRKYGGAR